MAACGIPAAMAVRFDRQGTFTCSHVLEVQNSNCMQLCSRLGLGLLVPAHDRPVGCGPKGFDVCLSVPVSSSVDVPLRLKVFTLQRWRLPEPCPLNL